MYQAYRSYKPISDVKEWLPITGDTPEEVREKFFNSREVDVWDLKSIYIAEVKEERKNEASM